MDDCMVFGLCSGRGKLLFIVLGEPRGSTGLGSRSVVQFSFEMFIIGLSQADVIYLTLLGSVDPGDHLKAYLWIFGA